MCDIENDDEACRFPLTKTPFSDLDREFLQRERFVDAIEALVGLTERYIESKEARLALDRIKLEQLKEMIER